MNTIYGGGAQCACRRTALKDSQMLKTRDAWFDMDRYFRDDEFDQASPFDQVARPHMFVRKLRRRPGGNHAIETRLAPSHNLTVQECSSIYAAAEFAAHVGMSLDMHVTLDFARLGLFEPKAVKAALRQFIRCYSAWCTDRRLPVGWISCVEMSPQLTYHAHIVLYVPGWPAHSQDPPPVNLRREFRRWAGTFVERNYGKLIPHALRVRGGFKESQLGHWILTSYLMKGFDRNAVLCSAHNSPDGIAIRLGDIIPWNYCDPGPVALDRRIGVSENLGPSRRQIGVPKGFEAALPRQPNWSLLFGADTERLSDADKASTLWRAPLPVPFRSTLEDRVLDVRKLYPAKFYEYVTRLSMGKQATLGQDQVCISDEFAAGLASL